MRITILNGNPDGSDAAFEGYLKRLVSDLMAKGNRVAVLDLRSMDISYCIGCWGCWVKTPGECVNRDDSGAVLREIVNGDFLLMASPVIMGFPSALLKKMMDRMIPIVLPYVEMVRSEVHHVARYSKYPLMGLLLAKRADTDDGDVRLISDIFGRTALNMKTRLALTALTSTPATEVADEIGRV
jgi:multimeric flavodoxin WrbA